MTTESLTESLRETLAVFEGHNPLTTSEVTERVDPGRRSTYERLQRLVEQDRLETKKVGASARVWWRPDSAASAPTPDAPDWPAAAESLVGDVLDGADVGVFVLDDEFDVAWVSEATERYFGLDREELLGQDKRRLVDERIASVVEDSSAFADTVLATYDDNTYTERFECHVTPGEGREERWLEHHSKPIEAGAYAGGRVELYYDVSKRKETERARGEDRLQFEHLVDAVEGYAIFTLDPEGRVQTWNPGARAIKGYDAEEIVGEHISTFYTAEDRDAGLPETNLARAAETGSVEDEGWRVRADGTRFWADVVITAIRDDDGELTGFAKVTHDATERREYERRLEDQAQRLERQRDELELELETIFARVSDGFYGLDEDLRFTYVNDRAESLLGLEDSSVNGRELGSELDVTENFANAIREALDSQEPVSIEDYYEPLDAWFENTIYPSEDGLSVYFRDVTDRKEREHELERYETVVETMSDAVYVVEDGRITMVNEAYTEMTGFDRRVVLGEPVSTVVGEEKATLGTEIEAQLAARPDKAGRIEAEFEFPSGDSLVAETQFALVDDTDGIERVGVVRDVTERKRREEELERYETIVETVDDGIYAVDDDGRLVTVNDGLCELTGYDREELIGAPASMVHQSDNVTERVESLAAEAAAGERSVAKIELDVVTKTGESVPCEARIAPLALGGGWGRCGVIRDVTDRLEREQELRDRVHQQEVVTELGQRALDDRDLDELMVEATRRVADTLDSDFCSVLDLDQAAENLRLRQGVGWDDGVVGSTTVSAVDDESRASFTLSSREPVVVDDIDADPRFSGPELLTSHGVHSGVSVVVGPVADPWGILEVHDAERRAFSRREVNFVQSVANILATAINRHEYEQELLRQREQLAAMDSLNTVVQEITDAVIEQSTREQIEETVCERLAATDSYQFAWIGDIDVHSQTVALRAEAGVEGYLDDITISVDPDDERAGGPTGRALRTGEVQTSNDVQSDESHDPWRGHVEAYGVRSSAAIPIVHEDSVYGVLNVYAGRVDAFEGRERDVVGQLGEIVGHAIAATERKRALMSDEVVELEFHIPDLFEALDIGAPPAGTITLDRTVPLEGDEYLVYGSATPDAVAEVEAIVDAMPHWESVTFYGDSTFELHLSEPPVLSVLASLGGSVDEAIIEDGDYSMQLRVPPRAEVRQIIDAVQEAYPAAELLKRQQVTRDHDASQAERHELLDALTDRQQTAIEAAHYAGFFEWPRQSTGEDLASSLGVSPPTFHQHLRKAERKVFDALFS
ncbi:PAS domain S-box protein [Halobacterium wangiae]|uniref:PAS domain S-box protein n=1 Tax=Halobacterium wangiae TaxID=2902623 RepID=UPI001E39F226|nr:PAS domain S-box protein [Halobacterium wangiae]